MNTSVSQNFERVVGPEFVPSTSRFDVERIMNSIRDFATVSEALRILGASVLLASMSVFLLQGWNNGNDISRYLMLLAQTGLLTAAGFAMSHGLKETKGARLFFGLALVSVPAIFTILGALLYSVFQWDGALTTYPGYATWQIENVASTGITLAGAMVVLLPVTVFCFAIMARHSAKTLSLNFFALNVMLLLPIRSSLAAGSVALLGIVYALYVVRNLIGKDRALKTAEGKFALATLFIPAGIILFRSMYFYQIDSLLIAMLSLAAFLAARQASIFPDRSQRIATMLDVISLPIALVFATALVSAFEPHLAWAWMAPVFSIAFALPALDLLRRTESRQLSKFAGMTVSLFVSLSFIFGLAIGPSTMTAFMCLIAGLLILMTGLAIRNRMTLVAGVVTLFASVIFGFDLLLAVPARSCWAPCWIATALPLICASQTCSDTGARAQRKLLWMTSESR